MTSAPRILIAPDKFKGSLNAAAVARALARGISAGSPLARITLLPIADGGDGTVDAALAADSGFSERTVTVTGPTGQRIPARFALRDGTAVLELAESSGLRRLPGGRLAHGIAQTRGLGETILHARDAGARVLVIGLGGSASTDGGAGMLRALGAQLLDENGASIPEGSDGLEHVSAVDLSPARDAVAGLALIAACDVTSPLLGPDGAAAVFGPQKGLAAKDLEQADARLRRLADLVEADAPASGPRPSGLQEPRGADAASSGPHALQLRDLPGAGAAGGTGFALLALGAQFLSGADAVFDLLRVDERIAAADVLITGEGRLDAQTLAGKGPAEAARRGRAAGCRVIAVAGAIDLDGRQIAGAGIDEAFDLLSRAAAEPSAEDDERTAAAIAQAEELLERVGREIGERLSAAR